MGIGFVHASAVWVSSACGFFTLLMFSDRMLLSALILLMYYPESPLKDREIILHTTVP